MGRSLTVVVAPPGFGRRLGFAAGLLACMAIAAPAHARDMNAMQAHAVLHEFAQCSVKYEHDLAKDITLGRRSFAGMSDQEFRRALDPRCLGLWNVRLFSTGLALRGELAEELVRRDLGQWPQLNPAAAAPLRWIVPTSIKAGPGAEKMKPATLQKLLAVFAGEARVGRLGECVVRRSPGGAAAVFGTKTDSKGEADALRALAPEVAACVKAGETSDFTGTGLRHAMALSYYRLVNTAPVAPRRSSEDLAIQAVHNFGACIVRDSPSGAAEQVLALDYQSDEYQARLRALAKGHERCVNGGWRLGSSQMLVAGAIAEALLESTVKPAELPQRLAFDPTRAVIAARSRTETMALCAALQAPQATARLLATEPTSREEASAVGTIAPVLTECLKKDTQLTVNKPALRALLALAAWRIVTMPRAPA